MARASLVRSSLPWLHVLQQMYRMMASSFQLLREGRRGDICTGVFEPEWAQSWARSGSLVDRAVQAEGPPTERSGARACSFQRQETSGHQPENWLCEGIPYAVGAGTKLRRWYCVRSDRKYPGAKQVERGDPPRSGLVPPRSEETGHPSVSERVQPSRQGSAEKCREDDKGRNHRERHSSRTTV